MTADDEAFLRAILEEPDEDPPRLVYADWLEERGNPRAAFIRLQCALACYDEDDRPPELEAREREMLEKHEVEWTGLLRGLVTFCLFHRGFIDEIATTAEGFLTHAETLFRLAPIREVHLSDVGSYAARLAGCPYLARLRYLDLSGTELSDSGAVLLANSPYLAGLTGLNLTAACIGDTGAEALARSPHLGSVTEMYLGGNSIGQAGRHALVASRHFRPDRMLHFQ